MYLNRRMRPVGPVVRLWSDSVRSGPDALLGSAQAGALEWRSPGEEKCCKEVMPNFRVNRSDLSEARDDQTAMQSVLAPCQELVYGRGKKER